MVKRNLYYFIGILSGFILMACSDQIGNDTVAVDEVQDNDTYLFVQVGGSDPDVETKAMAFQDLRHTETIWSVCALVFNEDDVLETVGARFGLEDKSLSIGSSVRGFLRAFKVNPGKKKIMLVANIGTTTINSKNTEYEHSYFKEGQTLEEVLELTKEYEDAEAGSEIIGRVTRLWLGLGEKDPLRKDSRLSLSSGIYDVEILPGVVNCLGMDNNKMNATTINDWTNQPVKQEKHNLDPSSSVDLYFNTALVRLAKITLNVTDKKKYPNARLDVTKIFVLNAANESAIVGEGGKAWGATGTGNNTLGGLEDSGVYSDQLVSNYKGAQVLSATYIEKFQPRNVGETDPEALMFEDECLYFLDNSCKDKSLGYPGFGDGKNPHGIGGTVKITGGKGKTGRCNYGIEEFYLYENTDIAHPTLLVVQGDFTYDDPEESGERKSEPCYYTVKIGEKVDHSILKTLPVGNRSDGQLQGVLRNVLYAISMTITQPGASSPLETLTKSEGNSNTSCRTETEISTM
ncbi:hypothetical protein [uncultured Parabacteroides sp.]|uniref:hypothetical protein n=1 Tax=uncultured Parabacteroides sp. TaxID=512312 RepID=UPI002602A5AD|nr:hypothetical protein [uncultured Parabacteroides sp.]